MSRYVLTPSALRDVVAIVEFIARDSPIAASRVNRELRKTMRKLARSPYIGHARSKVMDERIRCWPVYSYLILYNAETRPIRIQRVVHGARDLIEVLLGSF